MEDWKEVTFLFLLDKSNSLLLTFPLLEEGSSESESSQGIFSDRADD